MELTPQVINEVEFSMARRGYDPDQVDEFLEKVAVAVGDLNDRLTDLRELVASAERRALEAERASGERPERVVAVAPAPAPAPVADPAAVDAELETMKRTLLLAQRTADAAVREAEEEANRIKASAEAEARSAHDNVRKQVLDEINRLESTRDALKAETDALDRAVDAQRGRLVATIADLQAIVDDPARMYGTDSPAAVTGPADVEDEPMDEFEMPAEPPALEAPEIGTPAGPFVLAEGEGDDEAWARFGYSADEGPRTEPVLRLDRLDPDVDSDDAYLAELRKAMLDDTGAPHAGDLDLFDATDAGRGTRQRFGRRR
jgi:cell division initiation protein